MNIFQRIFSAIISCFSRIVSKAKPFLKKEIPVAMNVVDALITIVKDDAVNLITTLTPTSIDDVLVAKAKVYLPQALVALKIAGGCADLSTNDAIIQCAITNLKTYTKMDQDKAWLEVGAYISHCLVDGKLSFNELLGIVHSAVEARKK